MGRATDGLREIMGGRARPIAYLEAALIAPEHQQPGQIRDAAIELTTCEDPEAAVAEIANEFFGETPMADETPDQEHMQAVRWRDYVRFMNTEAQVPGQETKASEEAEKAKIGPAPHKKGTLPERRQVAEVVAAATCLRQATLLDVRLVEPVKLAAAKLRATAQKIRKDRSGACQLMSACEDMLEACRAGGTDVRLDDQSGELSKMIDQAMQRDLATDVDGMVRFSAEFDQLVESGHKPSCTRTEFVARRMEEQ